MHAGCDRSVSRSVLFYFFAARYGVSHRLDRYGKAKLIHMQLSYALGIELDPQAEKQLLYCMSIDHLAQAHVGT